MYVILLLYNKESQTCSINEIYLNTPKPFLQYYVKKHNNYDNKNIKIIKHKNYSNYEYKL